ncbi:hypothetical protein CKJ90_30140, partial [Klebsiella pneumoniae]
MEAIESVADTDHVLVMMDIGSALLSAETARQMLINDGSETGDRAGIDDPDSRSAPIRLKVMEAIESVADTDHVLVMMDIGSALLSAETA